MRNAPRAGRVRKTLWTGLLAMGLITSVPASATTIQTKSYVAGATGPSCVASVGIGGACFNVETGRYHDITIRDARGGGFEGPQVEGYYKAVRSSSGDEQVVSEGEFCGNTFIQLEPGFTLLVEARARPRVDGPCGVFAGATSVAGTITIISWEEHPWGSGF